MYCEDTFEEDGLHPIGQIFFSWNGKTTQGKPAPQGLYQLQIKAQLEQDDAPPEPAEINITFAHDPQWLK
jgi:flagellar basal-body rod modification protein FlgD